MTARYLFQVFDVRLNGTTPPTMVAALALSLLSVSAFCSAGVQPLKTADERPLIPLLQALEIPTRCDRGIAELRVEVKKMEAVSHARGGITASARVFGDWNRLQIALEDLQGPVEILNNMSPDPAVRTAAEGCLVAINKFSTDLLQSEKLYARFKAVKPRDAIEKKLRKNTLQNFEDTGVALPRSKRERMNAILGRLDELSKLYSRTMRDNNQKLVFTPEQVKGLPTAYLASAKRDEEGNYLLGFDYPSYKPFMEYADDSASRKRYQSAFTNRGTPKNIETLSEAISLRREMALLFGVRSYDAFAIRRKMAHSPKVVSQFLTEVKGAVEQVEKRELDELRVYRAEYTSRQGELAKTQKVDARIARWDVDYWQQKLKAERYAVDQNALRAYFPTDASIAWIMAIAGTLYDIDFKQVDVPVWHPSVQYFDVIDRASKQRIGGIYLDMLPREGKYGHAAAWPVRGGSTLAKRTPISVLVTNFDSAGLDSNELETMVHEFGHVLHGVLSTTRYVSQAGTSVEGDFVEAPSQMYEEWARALAPMSMLADFCKPACPRVDEKLVKRLDAAHNFGRGIRYSRQLLYASYDLAIHGPAALDPLATWNRMEEATLLGHVAGTQFPGQFDHLMNGYGAGYYGYMWSEVLALDMLSRYNGNLMDPVVGKRYRDKILSKGSELTGGELVRGFLGRAPNSKAFFDEISGQRLR